jgi:hypothetical protein
MLLYVFVGVPHLDTYFFSIHLFTEYIIFTQFQPIFGQGEIQTHDLTIVSRVS